MNYYIIPASEIDARIEELEKFKLPVQSPQLFKHTELVNLKSKSTLLTPDASIEERAKRWADEMVVIKNEKTEELKQNCITDYIAGATEQQAIDMLKDQAVENTMDKLDMQEAKHLLKRASVNTCLKLQSDTLLLEIQTFLEKTK